MPVSAPCKGQYRLAGWYVTPSRMPWLVRHVARSSLLPLPLAAEQADGRTVLTGCPFVSVAPLDWIQASGCPASRRQQACR